MKRGSLEPWTCPPPRFRSYKWNWRRWRRPDSGADGVWKRSCNGSFKSEGRFPPLSGQPLQKVRRRPLTLATVAGPLRVEAPYGRDPASGRWVFPLRLLLGLRPKQRMSPALEEKVGFTAVATGSYEKAVQVAAKWGTAADDSTAQRVVGRAGKRGGAATAARVAAVMEDGAPDKPKARRKAPAFSLILMMDGWMIRERGGQWGFKPPEAPAARVQWHEVKAAVLFRVQDQARKASGRGMLIRKYAVAWRGDPAEFGRRVYAEAIRRGLEEAGRLFVVADGGVWIWNLTAQHFPQAQGVLDFYHAIEHLGSLAQTLYEDPAAARAWVAPLAHQLKHGAEAGVLRSLAELLELCPQLGGEKAKTIAREVEYFNTHREHLHYEGVHAQGCPAGSGAIESFCSQLQGRFKRPGQFWTLQGETDLLTLDLALRNGDWDDLWNSTG